jgi:uncharacterized membrane protein
MNRNLKIALASAAAKRNLKIALASAAALAAGSAMAAPIDVSSVNTTITEAVTTISTLGLAVLSLVVVTKVFKWVARVL